jgi:hypothetical protein
VRLRARELLVLIRVGDSLEVAKAPRRTSGKTATTRKRRERQSFEVRRPMDPGGSGSRSATRAFEGFEGCSASRHGPSVQRRDAAAVRRGRHRRKRRRRRARAPRHHGYLARRERKKRLNGARRVREQRGASRADQRRDAPRNSACP